MIVGEVFKSATIEGMDGRNEELANLCPIGSVCALLGSNVNVSLRC